MKQLKDILKLNWNEKEFGQSKLKADYKRQLHNIIAVDSLNNIWYDSKAIFIPDKQVMYITDCNGEQRKFISATLEKKTKGKADKKEEYIKIKYDANFSPFAKLVVDYLLGRFVFHDSKLYDVNSKQAVLMDEITIQNLYGFKRDGEFVLEILSGIAKNTQVQPIRTLQPYQIAGNDFIIDLKEHRYFRTNPNEEQSYFKYYPVDYDTAKTGQNMADKFLKYVIADENSLHNAQLQAYYMAQVACGLRSKTNFFIAKSGVRTGKGLRHIALSGLFKKVDVELDLLKSKGFDSLNAWAFFAGGEMALATEQGDIVGDQVERVLKIIATEKTHVARSIGGNQGLVYLTGVLCIDTNRNVSLSDEMNGRKVLIQYKDRPENETDLEREAIFAEYWQAFAHPDKSPKIEGSIGFLLTSLDYFKEQSQKFEWRDVEVFNDVDLDDFQMLLLNALSYQEYVARTDNLPVEELFRKTYGTNGNKAKNALETIGVGSKRKKVNGRLVTVYIVSNQKRFNSFLPEDEKTKELKVFDTIDGVL
ncbi:TPA: phage resistance protein [Streptococcus suis]|uniref:phage resistance protein n=1 Tax=Streptococcus suis TaxID=1307 RepID=UPI00209B4765|nr:phage resistance protein [Streptococcus suis]MCO8172264.1 phage resistance protein [Streptococcus suis]MCO8180647.1 phage resistance protein [Streptococcus suis]MCO8190777.1 phage resistance protein [Streptococcus suis]MCO8201954.1 phage resistance protein [Streptococcus suis]MCO8223223.1 phage resistance protein [Streptococcus suis]